MTFSVASVSELVSVRHRTTVSEVSVLARRIELELHDSEIDEIQQESFFLVENCEVLNYHFCL